MMKTAFVVLLGGIATAAITTNAVAEDAFCVVKDVAAFDNRVHVFCGVAKNGPTRYFAVEVDTPLASHVIALVGANANQLMIAKKGIGLRVVYDEDASKNPQGCLESNCRRLTGVVLEQVQ